MCLRGNYLLIRLELWSFFQFPFQCRRFFVLRFHIFLFRFYYTALKHRSKFLPNFYFRGQKFLVLEYYLISNKTFLCLDHKVLFFRLVPTNCLFLGGKQFFLFLFLMISKSLLLLHLWVRLCRL